MSSNLPALAGSTLLAGRHGRDLARVERSVSREVAVAHGRAQVVAERGRVNAMAIESVALDAMQSGTQVARHAAVLAGACLVAEPMLRAITEQAGLALGQVVSDTARALR
jgi:hypothetical protein